MMTIKYFVLPQHKYPRVRASTPDGAAVPFPRYSGAFFRLNVCVQPLLSTLLPTRFHTTGVFQILFNSSRINRSHAHAELFR